MKGVITLDEAAKLRKKYPRGTRVMCQYMADTLSPISYGTKGTITNVDDMGTIHVIWDNGRALGLIPEIDRFTTI